MAQVYAERFDLTREEWRVLAALAAGGVRRAAALTTHTRLDKVAVSRALARMEGKGLVARTQDPADGRGWHIELLPAGRRLYRQVVPKVRSRERFLLDALDGPERAALDTALDRVLARAQQLLEQG